MATNTAQAAKRTRAVEDDMLATAHRLAAALHRAGAIDALTMREMDQFCLPPGLAPTGRTEASRQTD
jgi:hypothetical protein